MIPSGRLVLLLCVPAALAVGLLLEPGLWSPLLGLDAVILCVAALDVVWSRGEAIALARRVPSVLSLGELNRVLIEVTSHSPRPLRVEITCDLFTGAESPNLPVRLMLPPRGRIEATFQIEPKTRGAFSLGDHTARYRSRLGLWLRQQRLPASDPVRVYPDLAMTRAFEHLTRISREHALVRATRLRGGESEFARLRDYRHEDEYRAIDWKATARRQKLTAREYQLESDQRILFLLEAGRTMTAQVEGIAQFDRALNATLMLAHVATRGGDKVGLVAFDDAVRAFVPPAGGAHATRRLVQATYGVHARLVEPDYERAFSLLQQRVRRRSMVVLFTQPLDDNSARLLLRHMQPIARRHLPLVVYFRDLELERLVHPQGTGPGELYRRGAAAELLRWRGAVIKDLKRAGALVLEASPHGLTSSLINRYLEVKARSLL